MVAAAVGRFFLSQGWSALLGLAIWPAAAAAARLAGPLWSRIPAVVSTVCRWTERLHVSGSCTALLSSLWLAGACAICGGLNPSLKFTRWTPWVLAAIWFAVDRIPFARWEQGQRFQVRFARLLVRIGVWVITAGLGLSAMSGTGAQEGFGCALLAGFSLAFFRAPCAVRVGSAGEALSRFLVAAFAFWLLYPLAFPLPLGAGDSAWYAATVADAVSQFRASVFPVFVGQSPYQFAGSIFPVRFAPLLHHLAYVGDMLTLQSMPLPALLNLVLIGVGMAASATCFAAIRRVIPGSHWAAACLSCLYLACPGVLGVLYNSDLYMTWTTVPVLPLAILGTIRSFESPGRRGPLLLLVTAVGLLWWGHSPIALWTTLLLGLIQVVRLWIQRHDLRTWVAAAVAAGLFVVLVAFPLISVLVVTPEKSGDNTSYAVADPVTIASFVKEAFPGSLLPVSPNGRAPLSDLQLGWSLWAGLIVSGVAAVCLRRAVLLALWICAAFLMVLMLPIPKVNLTLWTYVPGVIRNPTGNWAMGRLYLVGAAFTVFALALACSGAPRKWGVRLFLALGVLWSGVEARRFLWGTEVNRHGAEERPSPLSLENLCLTRYSYLSFKLPPYFSHGVVDPDLEQRIVGPGGQVIAGNYQTLEQSPVPNGARVLGEGEFAGTRQGRTLGWKLAPSIDLLPGKKYVLEVHFLSPAAPGVLVIASKDIHRVYGLPTYGEPKSFGAQTEATHLLSLFTTSSESQTVTLTFYADASVGSQSFDRFATYRLIQYDPAALPVFVRNWIPYEAHVNTQSAGLLETPRLFQRGYIATVNGRSAPVKKSAAGLVAFEVPKGESEVRLTYRAPWLLLVSYVTSILGFAAVASIGIGFTWRRWCSGEKVAPTP